MQNINEGASNMAGSIFGTIFKVSTWGESHGKAVGVVVDGCPAGLLLCEADIQRSLDLRKPGQSPFATPRKESDTVEILSGVFEGRTTGTPISMLVYNQSQRSQDYSEIAGYYRPGHADYTFDEKYGFRDWRGGGRSSGRETIGRVAAGAIAQKLLEECGIRVQAFTRSIGPVIICEDSFSYDDIFQNAFYMPDKEAALKAEAFVREMIAEKDSVGGVVECHIDGVPAGLGDPVFEKLNANLAKAICSIGAVRGFEIGDGFAVSTARGSENNDAFILSEEQKSGDKVPKISKASNHAGGVLGGISDGTRITFRAAFKPTPSISREQRTVTRDGEEIRISIGGRHDPIIMPRAVIVVQSMASLVLADALLLNMTARMDSVRNFYRS